MNALAGAKQGRSLPRRHGHAPRWRWSPCLDSFAGANATAESEGESAVVCPFGKTNAQRKQIVEILWVLNKRHYSQLWASLLKKWNAKMNINHTYYNMD